jgi:hypothetical protein
MAKQAVLGSILEDGDLRLHHSFGGGSGTETVPWYESGGDFDGSSWFVGSTKEEESNEGLARERVSGETNMCWMMGLRAPK